MQRTYPLVSFSAGCFILQWSVASHVNAQSSQHVRVGSIVSKQAQARVCSHAQTKRYVPQLADTTRSSHLKPVERRSCNSCTKIFVFDSIDDQRSNVQRASTEESRHVFGKLYALGQLHVEHRCRSHSACRLPAPLTNCLLPTLVVTRREHCWARFCAKPKKIYPHVRRQTTDKRANTTRLQHQPNN